MEVDLNEMANENQENNVETDKNQENNVEANKNQENNDQIDNDQINNVRTDISENGAEDYPQKNNKSQKNDMKEISRKYDSKMQVRRNIMDTYKDHGRKDRIKINQKQKNSAINIQMNGGSPNNRIQPGNVVRKKGLADPVNNFNKYNKPRNSSSDIQKLAYDLKHDHQPSISRSPKSHHRRANSAYTRDSSYSIYHTEDDINPDAYVEEVKEKRYFIFANIQTNFRKI